MGAGLDVDPDGLRRVADDLAIVAAALDTLTRHLRQCTVTAAHFGAPDAGGRLGAVFAAGREEVLAALAGSGQLASTLVDELRAGVDAAVDADRRSAQELRAAGEGMV